MMENVSEIASEPKLHAETHDDSVMAFTDFGIETLKGLAEIYKANPHLLTRSDDPK